MFYRIKENNLYDYADYKYEEDCLETDIISQSELTEHRNKVIVENGILVLNPNYEQEEAQKEAERILALSMTRSDFFDGTIKAFGADSDDLLIAIESVLSTMQIPEIEKKVAINNYRNALNFYRKHPLFTMLSDVPIPVGQNIVIQITSEQWDKFFDETDKKNPDAYKELLPAEIENEEELPE